MRQVWEYEEWKDIPLGEAKSSFIKRSRLSPRLGEISVSELCCLAYDRYSPVGIYVFSRDSFSKSEPEILYVGKTHGRSLHERIISHIDHRKPTGKSPHLAKFVQTLVKQEGAADENEAVLHILNMKVTWLPIPSVSDINSLKKSIALIERRLLWNKCLDPA
ncbi:MAG TPA: hypothetical protein DCM40_40700, partial [Maribacter sp.]|nr:hypothetical protein [Maribacter sp.]